MGKKNIQYSGFFQSLDIYDSSLEHDFLSSPKKESVENITNLYLFPSSMYISTMISLGTSLEDGSNVLAKVASYGGSGTLIIEREMHILGRLSESLEASGRAMRVVDL